MTRSPTTTPDHDDDHPDHDHDDHAFADHNVDYPEHDGRAERGHDDDRVSGIVL